MEDNLDLVEEGKKSGYKLSISFTNHSRLKWIKRVEIEKVQIKDEPAGFNCEKCGHPMVIKLGRFGKFYACSNFQNVIIHKPLLKILGLHVQLVARESD